MPAVQLFFLSFLGLLFHFSFFIRHLFCAGLWYSNLDFPGVYRLSVVFHIVFNVSHFPLLSLSLLDYRFRTTYRAWIPSYSPVCQYFKPPARGPIYRARMFTSSSGLTSIIRYYRSFRFLPWPWPGRAPFWSFHFLIGHLFLSLNCCFARKNSICY